MKKLISITVCMAILLSCSSVLTSGAYMDEMITSGWQVWASSVNANNGVQYEIPENAIDESTNTVWHAMVSPRDELPQFIAIQLPNKITASGFRYYPRTDSNAGGICTKYEIWASDNGELWQMVASGTWGNNREAKTAEFDKNVSASYFMLRLLEAVNGFASAGEIRLLSKDPKKETETLGESGLKKTIELYAQKPEDELSVSGWTLTASSVNANNGVECEIPSLAIDGNTATHWLAMLNPKAELPHYITVDQGEKGFISGYRYYPRTDGHTGGICTSYEIAVSDDNENFITLAEGLWNSDTDPKTVYFPVNVKAKYVRLLIKDAVGGFGSAGEIRLLKEDKNKASLDLTELSEKYGDYYIVARQFMETVITTDCKDTYSPMLMNDSDRTTYWHSEFAPNKLPVTLDFDLGYEYTVRGMRYVPRQDGNLTGHFMKFEIFSSNDGKNYTSLGKFEFEEADKTDKDVMFAEPIHTRYFKIFLEEGLYGYGTCAEIYCLQTESEHKRDEEASERSFELYAGKSEVKVKKNGSAYVKILDVSPVIENGRAMVPLRGIFEEMGAEVLWKEYSQTVEIRDGNTEAKLRVEDDLIEVNGIKYNLDVPPFLKNGRVFVPLRFISEAFGYNVSFDEESGAIKISNK